LIGVGLGHSRQKFFYLPEPQTDFIFAIIGEELGFLGACFVILLFMFFIWRGYKTALTAPDLFGKFLATGLTTLIALQFLINIAVVTASMPVTGMPLPFISYGGSSLIITMSQVGILLNISRYTEAK
jgi:cell division protein FtsW